MVIITLTLLVRASRLVISVVLPLTNLQLVTGRVRSYGLAKAVVLPVALNHVKENTNGFKRTR